MAEVIYLQPRQQMPAFAEEDTWLMIEASDDGRFFGTGFARKYDGESVFYASLPESDVTLETALNAAQQWADKYDILRIWVQASPD